MFGFAIASTLVAILMFFDHFVTKVQYVGKSGVGYYVAHYTIRRVVIVFIAMNTFLLWSPNSVSILVSTCSSVVFWVFALSCMGIAPHITANLDKFLKKD